MKRTWIALLIGTTLAAAGGCNTGYTTASPYRKGIKTIATPIWQRGKEEYRRDIEMRLTEALVKRIESETPYKVVDKRSADTELTGTLRRVEQAVVSFDSRTGLPREIPVRLVLDFTWTDLRTGRVIKAKKGLRVVAEYIPLAPFSETFYQGSEDAVNKAAERIVQHMLAEW